MKFDVKSLLKDKNVLYIVAFLAITNALSYLIAGNYDAVIFFIVVGFLTTYFSKNMIIVMLVAMLSTNLLLGTRAVARKVENMATRAEEDKKAEDKKVSEAAASETAAANEHDAENKPETNGKKKNKVDYAATLEEAYDNLEGLIGKTGIEKMTTESASLLKKQEALVQSMKGMEPLLQNAQKMMESFDVKNLEKMSSMLTGTMNKLGGIGAPEKPSEKK